MDRNELKREMLYWLRYSLDDSTEMAKSLSFEELYQMARDRGLEARFSMAFFPSMAAVADDI